MIKRTLTKKDEEDSKVSDEFQMIHVIGKKEVRTQKISSNKNLHFVVDPSAKVFCISVDGSKHSESAFNLISGDFLGLKSTMLVIHIYNEKKNEEFNHKNKKDTIIETYGLKMVNYPSSKFMIENRIENTVHPLEQVHNYGLLFQANYLVSGYFGIKGPKGEYKELSKGINYLLGNGRIKTMIIKDTVPRSQKLTKGYKWLIFMDKKYTGPSKCFLAFSELIDPERDFVYGLTLKESLQSDVDDVQDEFIEEIKKRGIKNFAYEFASYDKVPSKIVEQKVNFEESGFDFLVMYNNRDKYLKEGENSDIVNIITNCLCSICIYNF
jgi:hypothetical protein